MAQTSLRGGSGFDTDVFIVGGGPAGLAGAIAARQKGLDVTVADGVAPPIEKACGEGLMPETLASLQTLGVKFHRDEGINFLGISFVDDATRVSANFPRRPGLGLSRPVLQQRLIERTEQCGVKLLWKKPVTGIDGHTLQLSSGGAVRARWIIGADGQGSRVRRWSGLESSTAQTTLRFANRRRYRVPPWSDYVEIYWGRHVQAYVTPTGTEEVCVVTMADTPERASFERTFTDLPELSKRLCGAQLTSRERGAVSAMRSLRHIQRGNVALLGDASGSVDAITGEGLRLAFRQSVALADALAAGDLTQYERAHRKIAWTTRLIGNLMLLLGRSPRLRARVFRAFSNSPELFAQLLTTHAGDPSSAQLLSTGALLGVRLLTA